MAVWIANIEHIVANIQLERCSWVGWLLTFRRHSSSVAIEDISSGVLGWA
jgi:hypothetical protein